MITISNSEIGTWKRCPRKWYLSYYLGAGLADEPPVSSMALGTWVHAALQGAYDPGLSLDPAAVLGVLHQAALDRHPGQARELAAQLELAGIMVSGYQEWLASSDDAGMTVVAVEQEMTVPLEAVPGVQLRVKLDQRVEDGNGHLRFLDLKTAASFEKHEMLALDPQFRFYSLVMAMDYAASGGSGLVPMGGIVHTLRRCKRTARSSPPYYASDHFRYGTDEVLAEQDTVAQVCREIMAARGQLDAAARDHGNDLAIVNSVQRTACRPSKMPHDCSWSCPFVQLCPMMDDGSDWPGALLSSGRWAQRDPYAYYAEDPVAAVRAVLAGGTA